MTTENTHDTVHKSVLVSEVLEYLAVKPDGVYLDVTFGAGGHTRAILESNPTCHVIAIDWDTRSLETFGKDLQEEFPGRLTLLWGNFALLYKMLKKERRGNVDGILADFGTSQMQILERDGFSIYRNTPLDMRMSPSHQKTTAADIINTASEEKLRDIFWTYGEEKYTKMIVSAIMQDRIAKRFTTTGELADLIERVVPKEKDKRQKIHPATRVFQALRIHVNKELENIVSFLSAAMNLLKPGGRLVCISFHSLEDRLVKQYFVDKANAQQVKILTDKVVTASDEELERNPSSRSAKLRAIEFLSRPI